MAARRAGQAGRQAGRPVARKACAAGMPPGRSGKNTEREDHLVGVLIVVRRGQDQLPGT